MSKKLYVGNMGFDVDQADLKRIFSVYGLVEEVEIVMDSVTGRSKRFGFVGMSTEAEAETALASLNGRSCGGRPLVVEWAQPCDEILS
jgi:RNA recognition motif-containing protein